ncbi:MAG: UDP-N-acetylmuramate dehydrogenase [Candidatus Uhrbacteria bacterium]|nr:UDP-N-acetylmuramate dehydrogenase [Candidatus Uhrbacteria bacterium]
MTNDLYLELKSLPGFVENEPMAKHTNFRIGGVARYYVVASTKEACIHAIEVAERAGIAWYVYGGGSNLLVADKGFDGLMIQVGFRSMEVNGEEIVCDAGVITALVARKAAEAGLAGFEWAAGVPGTIGGAIYGNAGCYGGEMKDAIVSVDAYRLSDRQCVTLTNAECGFGYRESHFKKDRHIIFGCTLRLVPGDAKASLQRIDEINAKRKEKQPLGESGAGCMFKNVEFADVSEIAQLQSEVDVPASMIASKTIGAGWLIDHAGLLGRRIGNIEVSPKHGNFLINHGGGTADEVAQLVSICQMEVRNRFGIRLQTEVQFVGW